MSTASSISCLQASDAIATDDRCCQYCCCPSEEAARPSLRTGGKANTEDTGEILAVHYVKCKRPKVELLAPDSRGLLCGFAPDLLLSSGESPYCCRPRNRLTLREVTERCREVSWHCVRSFMLPLLILPGWLVAAQVAHASPSSSPGGAGPASVLASLETTASLIPSRASP